MADKKVSELTAITNLSGDDLLLVVDDPNGSPSSRKVTVSNFFANVVPATTHKGVTTFKANTSFTGKTVTSTANLNVTSTLTVNNMNVFASVNDRVQVANLESGYVSNAVFTSTAVTNTVFQSALANTNIAISDRVQVANLESTYVTNSVFTSTSVTNTAFQSALANTNSRFNSGDYVHVRFALSTNSTTNWLVSGGGADTAEANPTLYLYKGLKYSFTTTSEDPITILNANTSSFSNGVSGDANTELFFVVPQKQTSNLIYQSSTHSGTITGTLVIVT